jgi:hypothetical protein
MTEVEWPAQFGDRTPASERSRNNKYEVTLSKAFDELESELDRLGVDDYRYSFDARQRQKDGRPYSRASPDDPAFVLHWTKRGEQYAVGCDAYSRLRDNVRTVGLYVREKRMMERRDVRTGETEFSNLRLPSGDDAVAGEAPPHVVLGVEPDADAETVREAFRERAKEAHADAGGSTEEFIRVKEAREEMLGGGA